MDIKLQDPVSYDKIDTLLNEVKGCNQVKIQYGLPIEAIKARRKLEEVKRAISLLKKELTARVKLRRTIPKEDRTGVREKERLAETSVTETVEEDDSQISQSPEAIKEFCEANGVSVEDVKEVVPAEKGFYKD